MTKGHKELLELGMNYAAAHEKFEEKIRPQDAPIERLQGENGVAFDEMTEEAKANSLPLLTNAGIKGLEGDQDQNSIRKGMGGGVPNDKVPLPMVLDNAKDSLANDKVKIAPTGGSLTDPKWCHHVAIESLAGKNKVVAALFVVATTGQLEFLSPLLKGGLKTRIDVAAQQVVSGAMQGINGTMFAYGVTSSGKTHTMHGEQKSSIGNEGYLQNFSI